jgi:hypothetical protein
MSIDVSHNELSARRFYLGGGCQHTHRFEDHDLLSPENQLKVDGHGNSRLGVDQVGSEFVAAHPDSARRPAGSCSAVAA